MDCTAEDKAVGDCAPSRDARQSTARLCVRRQHLGGRDNGSAAAEGGVTCNQLGQVGVVQDAAGDTRPGPAASGLTVVREGGDVVEGGAPEACLVQQRRLHSCTGRSSRVRRQPQKLAHVEERMVPTYVWMPLAQASHLRDAVIWVRIDHHRERGGLLWVWSGTLGLFGEIACYNSPELLSCYLGGHPELLCGRCAFAGLRFSEMQRQMRWWPFKRRPQ
mmetsp:Transcript_138010/g.428932  ORF Transcript_138010/g.428932 Transcript_138010/m.428932 type:complete len:219 (+) Transcript_138010:304-960(+)